MILQMKDNNEFRSKVNKLLSLFNVDLNELHGVLEDGNSVTGFLSNCDYYQVSVGKTSSVLHMIYDNIGLLFNGEFQIVRYPFQYVIESFSYEDEQVLNYKNKTISSDLSATVLQDKLRENIKRFMMFYNEFINSLSNVVLVNAPVVDDLLKNFCDLSKIKYKCAVNMFHEDVPMLCYWIIHDDDKVSVLWKDSDICVFVDIDRNISWNNDQQYLSYDMLMKFYSIHGNKIVQLMNGTYKAYYSESFANNLLDNHRMNFHNFVNNLFGGNKPKISI